MDNSSNVVFDNDVTFAYTLPAVTTDAATNITSASATLNGNLTSLGSASYVDVYFVAGLDTNYVYAVYVGRMTSPGPVTYNIPGGLTP